MQRGVILLLVGGVVGVIGQLSQINQHDLSNHRLTFFPSQPDPGPRPIRFSDNHFFYNFTTDDKSARESRGGKPHPVYNKKKEQQVLSNVVNNHPVTARSVQETELRTESSFIQGNVAAGRSGFGGGGYHCQNLNSFNPGCCNQGFINCCGGGGGGGGWNIQKPHPPPIFNHGWGSWKAPQYPIHPHPPPHPPPRPPIIAPPIIPVRPHPHPPPPTFGWYAKPGSCQYKSPLAFLSKLNIFSKGHGHGHDKGWGWDPHPPSQNAGYHFYRRSGPAYPFLPQKNTNHLTKRKRQLDLPLYKNNNYENNIVEEQEKQSYGDRGEGSEGWGQVQGQGAGLGSVSGRILGWNGGFGGGITTGWSVTDHRCNTDTQCPGSQKCCQGICKTPNFFKF